MFKKLEDKCRESNTFAWGVYIVGTILMILIWKFL
jgi:hypothetical protein